MGMKKENIGAYGFDRSKKDYTAKVEEEEKRIFSELARTLGRKGGLSKSDAKTLAVRENGKRPPKPGSRPRGRPKLPRA
jgi:hypothetical protein